MSHYLIEQLATKSNVAIEANSQVVGLEGDDHLEAIVLENRRSGVRRRAETQALFVFIGADADTAWLPPAVIRDERGYVCTGATSSTSSNVGKGRGRSRATPIYSRPAFPRLRGR
jgi:thioredoxin reductase (NADPH)